MNDNELKPCPYCGKKAEMKTYKHVPRGTDYVPRCTDASCCGRSTKRFTTREAAVYFWNRRATDDGDDIGESVFLTREEAEAALAVRRDVES